MIYKLSIKSTQSGSEGEMAQYKGYFRNGKREGRGKIIWADGSCFEGEWKNDERCHGRMIMNNGCVYIGHFLNDKFHGKQEILLMPSSTIYLGEFKQGQTKTVGMLLYSNGNVYYGQMSQFQKQGVGKVIEYLGGFQEGTWENDKLSGPACRVFEAESGNLYSGPYEDGRRIGKGRLYDAERDEVYDGEFENNKKSGAGMIYLRNGQVMKGTFRNNMMEGPFENCFKASKQQVEKIFKNAHR